LEVAFATEELRDLCIHISLAEQHFGYAVACNLRTRLADLSAMSNASEVFVLPGRPTVITIDNGREGIAVNLSEGIQLVYAPAHGTPRLLPSGGTDWSRTSRIKILRIDRDA